VSRVKRFLEWALSFPLLRFVESGIFTLYRRRIQRKVTGKPSHGVRLTPDEIKLHTNDHSERLMALWEQRLAQVATRTGSPEQPSLMAVSYTAERSAV
jgi:hypothetical protein